MADPQGKVREIAWNELFPWLLLARAVRIALYARVLLLGAAGLIVMTLGWQALLWTFSDSADPVIAEWTRVVYGGANQAGGVPVEKVKPWVWEKSGGFDVAISARSAHE